MNIVNISTNKWQSLSTHICTDTLRILRFSNSCWPNSGKNSQQLFNSTWTKVNWRIFAVYFSKNDGIVQCLLWRQATVSILITTTATTTTATGAIAHVSSISEVWSLSCWLCCSHTVGLSANPELANTWQQILQHTCYLVKQCLQVTNNRSCWKYYFLS